MACPSLHPTSTLPSGAPAGKNFGRVPPPSNVDQKSFDPRQERKAAERAARGYPGQDGALIIPRKPAPPPRDSASWLYPTPSRAGRGRRAER